jgi:hypothetical protein
MKMVGMSQFASVGEAESNLFRLVEDQMPAVLLRHDASSSAREVRQDRAGAAISPHITDYLEIIILPIIAEGSKLFVLRIPSG